MERQGIMLVMTLVAGTEHGIIFELPGECAKGENSKMCNSHHQKEGNKNVYFPPAPQNVFFLELNPKRNFV